MEQKQIKFKSKKNNYWKIIWPLLKIASTEPKDIYSVFPVVGI